LGAFDWEVREEAQARRREEYQRRLREEEEARRKKLEAERRYQPPAPKPTGLETRQVPSVPQLGQAPTTRQVYEARPERPAAGPTRYPWGTGLPSLEELRGTPKVISETVGFERGPSWVTGLRPAFEEAAHGTASLGPTILGFGAGAEADRRGGARDDGLCQCQ